jgi:2Fe-2S ferredoxin
MVKIRYIDVEGVERVVDAKVGQSLMEAAVKSAIPGIVAECGGACACGTCRVLVDEAWRAATGEASAMEQEMVAFVEDARADVRLSCQIKITEALDGLVVRTPESQYGAAG